MSAARAAGSLALGLTGGIVAATLLGLPWVQAQNNPPNPHGRYLIQHNENAGTVLITDTHTDTAYLYGDPDPFGDRYILAATFDLSTAGNEHLDVNLRQQFFDHLDDRRRFNIR